MTFAFIGLGNLGKHLAASLLREGFQTVVSDLSKGAVAALLEAGAMWAEGFPADLSTCDAR